MSKYCLFYRALLQKRPIIVSILLTVAAPFRLYVLCCAWLAGKTSEERKKERKKEREKERNKKGQQEKKKVRTV